MKWGRPTPTRPSATCRLKMASSARARLKELCDQERWSLEMSLTACGGPRSPMFTARCVVRDVDGEELICVDGPPCSAKRDAREAAAAEALCEDDPQAAGVAMIGELGLTLAVSLLASRACICDEERVGHLIDRLLSSDALSRRAAAERQPTSRRERDAIAIAVGSALEANADAILLPLMSMVRAASAPLADEMQAVVAQAAQREAHSSK